MDKKHEKHGDGRELRMLSMNIFFVLQSEFVILVSDPNGVIRPLPHYVMGGRVILRLMVGGH